MKKIITLSIAISILVGQGNMSNKKLGIGFDFHMFPGTFFSDPGNYEYEGAGITDLLGFYLSYETLTGILIEPGYSSYSTTIEYDYDDSDDYEYTNTWRTMSLGVFKIMKGEDVRTYYGVRLGKSWYEYDPDSEYDEEYEVDNFMIAPTFGAEYFIGKNFSFGGEVLYKIITSEDTESSSSYDKKTSSANIEPKFLVRFYF